MRPRFPFLRQIYARWEDMPERRSRHHKHQSKRSSAAYPDVQKHRQESFQQVAYEGQRTAPESAVGVCIVGAGVAVWCVNGDILSAEQI